MKMKTYMNYVQTMTVFSAHMVNLPNYSFILLNKNAKIKKNIRESVREKSNVGKGFNIAVIESTATM